MSRSTRMRSSLVALVTLLALLSMSAGVSAKPTFQEHFSEVIPAVDVCGLVVTLEVRVNRSFTFTETSFKVTGNLTLVFTAEDGRSVVGRYAGQNAGTVTDNGDGTFTILESYSGNVLVVSSRGGGPLMRMVGFVTVLTTVDENTDPPVATSEIIVQHGQFDQTDGNYIACDVLLAALG